MASAKEPRRLSSWKEIAGYLGCDERTARRWERERKLPVYRPPGGKRAHIYAFADELDQWLKHGGAAQPTPPRLYETRKVRAALAVAVVLAAILGGTAISIRWSRQGNPAGGTIAGQTLRVWDESGKLLWSHTFSQPVRNLDELRRIMEPGRGLQVADLDGDGSREVLVVAAPPEQDPPAASDQLACFSSRGKLLWSYTPRVTIAMGDTRFDGPWGFKDVLTTRHSRQSHVWLAVAHWRWRPSFVIRLTPSGQASMRFVNAGTIWALGSYQSARGTYILAGGVNNEYASASLAVFREDAPPACSPQTRGTRFACTEGPSGLPERYFLFPPSEVSRFARPYNRVQLIERGPRPSLVTLEIETPSLHCFYQFSEALEPVSVSFSDGFGVAHRQFERQGLLNHAVEDCPELKRPVKVRRWDPQSGWTSVEVPLTPGVRPDVWKKEN